MSEAIHLRAMPHKTTSPASRAAAQPGKLTNLQVLRAVAATLVVVFHISLQLERWHGEARFLAVFNDQVGALGVALFFAISGFLMAQLVRASDAPTFLLHRVARIYPTYLLIIGLFMAVAPLVVAKPSFDAWTLTLAPVGERAYVLGRIEWTLIHEVAFYLTLFGLSLLGLARRIELVAAIWLAALALVAATGLSVPLGVGGLLLTNVLLSDANVPFVLGLLIPWAARRGALPGLLGPALALAAVPLLAIVLTNAFPHDRWVGGSAAALIVAGLVRMRQVSTERPVGRALVRLGDWSYVLYLVHPPILALTDGLVPARVPSGALFVIKLAAAFGVAAVLGPLDVRLYRVTRRLVDQAALSWKRLAAFAFTALYLACAIVVAVDALGSLKESARARAAVARLPAGSLVTQDRLAAAITEANLRAPASFVGEVESATAVPTGQIVVTGWALDLDRPAAPARLVVACAGQIAVIGAPQRYRRDVAAMLRRPDLARMRIGFTATIEPGTCPREDPLVTLFSDGEARLLPGREVPVAPPERAAAPAALVR